MKIIILDLSGLVNIDALDMRYYSAMKIVQPAFRNDKAFPTVGIVYKPIEFETKMRYNHLL
jgi:hypothetical protein